MNYGNYVRLKEILSDSLADLNNFVSCPICCERYTTQNYPSQCVNHHPSCVNCITNIYNKSETNYSSRSLCQTCRAVIPSPKNQDANTKADNLVELNYSLKHHENTLEEYLAETKYREHRLKTLVKVNSIKKKYHLKTNSSIYIEKTFLKKKLRETPKNFDFSKNSKKKSQNSNLESTSSTPLLRTDSYSSTENLPSPSNSNQSRSPNNMLIEYSPQSPIE